MSSRSTPLVTDDDDSWNWDPIEEEFSPKTNAPPFFLETVPADDESIDEPARTETHDDAIEMFPMRNETSPPVAKTMTDETPTVPPSGSYNSNSVNHVALNNVDDASEVEAIPFADAIPIPMEQPPEEENDDSEVVVMASLVDSNDPAAVRTFQNAPAAQRAAIDVRDIPKKGPGWTAGFERDWTSHALHMLLCIVGIVLLVYYINAPPPPRYYRRQRNSTLMEY